MKTRDADRLWEDLRGAFSNAERIIKEIIEHRAWEPLGYESFAEAWLDRMAGVRLATDSMRAHVVYALFDSGLSAEGVEEALPVGSGVTRQVVAVLRRQRVNGVPAHLATTRVRSHDRINPSPAQVIRVRVSHETYVRYREAAEEIGSSLKGEAERAVLAHFEGLLS